MQVALVKFVTQSCNDPSGGVTDFVNSAVLTLFDKSFNCTQHFIKFPTLTPISSPNVDVELEKTSANKLIQIATQKLQTFLKKSSLIFVASKREKELVLEFCENNNKNVVILT